MRFFSAILVSSALALSAFAPCAAWGGPVDINTADASTLARELKGIGPSRAQAIVAYRTEHGPFKSVDDLRLVKNMPQKVIDNNRELLRLDGVKGARPEAKSSARTDSRKEAAPQKP
jgi:competence protein ComEA